MKKLKIPFKNKKSVIIAVIAIVAVAAICISAFLLFGKIRAVDTIKLSDISKADDINLIGHRGLSSQAPENTIPAIEAAADKGMTAVEFDIQLTKDNVWVLSHDEKINRMTNGKGKISSYTFYDLFDYSIDNGANFKDYDTLNIPSLDDALDSCLEHSLEPMIEIKNYNKTAIKKLVDSITEHGFEKSCEVISFNHDALDAVRSVNENIKLVYLVSELDEEQLVTCFEHPDYGVSFKADKKHNNDSVIKKLIKNDITVYCWTVDDKDTIDYYYKAGVRNFVTNRIIP